MKSCPHFLDPHHLVRASNSQRQDESERQALAVKYQRQMRLQLQLQLTPNLAAEGNGRLQVCNTNCKFATPIASLQQIYFVHFVGLAPANGRMAKSIHSRIYNTLSPSDASICNVQCERLYQCAMRCSAYPSGCSAALQHVRQPARCLRRGCQRTDAILCRNWRSHLLER